MRIRIAGRRALLLIAAATAVGLASSRAMAEAIVKGDEVTFRLDAHAWPVKPKRVAVVGSFQGWDKDKTPLRPVPGKPGVYEATVKVAGTGPQSYKFLVDGERYLTDETGDRAQETDDGFGGKNSGFTIGGANAPAPTASASPAGTEVTFTLDTSSWQQQPKTLSVAGDFNGWKADALPMTRKGTVWTATARLPAGVAHYKFVADGERWLPDPKADASLETDDGNGGKNSGVRVAPPADAAPQAAAQDANAQGVLFSFDASQSSPKPTKVNLAGTFNGWSTDATPMARNGDVWSVRVPLDDGQHAYKFVLDGDRWTPDPKAEKALETDDGNGGMNSGVIVGFDPRKAPPAKDNAINADAVKFRASDPADVNVFEPGAMRVRVRAQAHDVKQVNLRFVGGYDAPIALERLGEAGGLDLFAGIVRAKPGADAFKFEIDLVDGSAVQRLRDGSSAAFSVSTEPTFVTPDWAKDAVWYQIFPERFRNGDASNDPGDKPMERRIRWQSDWWKSQPGEAGGAENFYEGKGDVWQRRYGGDIQGLRQALPYLKSLGITALYLNPMFEAESMHKYDATDYRHIDDNFGVKGDLAKLTGETDDPATWKWSDSDKIFLDFVAEAHRQGFKVVLDGVFNHVGKAHPFFQDVLANGKRSKYADWFVITDWGDEKNWHKMDDPYAVHGKPGGIQWKAWDKDSGELPVFKKDPTLGLAPGPREHVFAITKRWLAPDGLPERGVDGWRLDVAPDIPHPFWRDWRRVVKETKPDAYITGEIWPWAQAWINAGDQFDATMNYQFAMPAQQFFVDEKTQMKPSVFGGRMVQLEMAYPFQAALVMMNLYDSHDTDRLASMFVNPDRQYDAANRPQDNAKDRPYSPAKPTPEQWQRLRQAAAMQYAYVGAPMIYYGTEAGMWSPDDPSNRQPMVWKDLEPYDDPQVKFDADLFAYYQRLAAIRSAMPALRRGLFTPLMSDDARNLLVFRRGEGKDAVYVAINRSGVDTTIDVPIDDRDATGPLIDWLDKDQARVSAQADGRPSIAPTGRGGVRASGGAARVPVKAYGAAILTVAR